MLWFLNRLTDRNEVITAQFIVYRQFFLLLKKFTVYIEPEKKKY